MGNYFNQELFGGPTSLPWGLRIDPAHRPVGYEGYATFHPTFLYELGWNLALAAALVWLGHHRRIRAPGLFALYVAGYSGFRILEELLRTDPAHHVLGLRLNFFVATVLCLTSLAWFVRTQRPSVRRRHGGPAVLGVGWRLVALTGGSVGAAPESLLRHPDRLVPASRVPASETTGPRPDDLQAHPSAEPLRRLGDQLDRQIAVGAHRLQRADRRRAHLDHPGVHAHAAVRRLGEQAQRILHARTIGP